MSTNKIERQKQLRQERKQKEQLRQNLMRELEAQRESRMAKAMRIPENRDILAECEAIKCKVFSVKVR